MTEKLILRGFYNYMNLPCGRGELDGEIDVDIDGTFVGSVIDHGSSVPKQKILGHLGQEEGRDRMRFLKFPQKSDLANLAYVLEKRSDGLHEGRYSGKWKAMPMKLAFNPDNSVFVLAIDTCIGNLSDIAEISLIRE
jgi:hypothetical protein